MAIYLVSSTILISQSQCRSTPTNLCEHENRLKGHPWRWDYSSHCHYRAFTEPLLSYYWTLTVHLHWVCPSAQILGWMVPLGDRAEKEMNALHGPERLYSHDVMLQLMVICFALGEVTHKEHERLNQKAREQKILNFKE